MNGVFYYAAGWFSFAVVHSMLASASVQNKLESRFRGSYRLGYNVLSVVHIVLVVAVGWKSLSTETFLLLSMPIFVAILGAMKLLGLTVILLSLRQYDLGRFSGVTHLRKFELLSDASKEPLQLSGLNSRVRHPLYSGAFILLWGASNSSFGFWTAVWGSVYLVVGTLFEERKLVRIYGDAYKQYQAIVPRYLPNFKKIH